MKKNEGLFGHNNEDEDDEDEDDDESNEYDDKNEVDSIGDENGIDDEHQHHSASNLFQGSDTVQVVSNLHNLDFNYTCLVRNFGISKSKKKISKFFFRNFELGFEKKTKFEISEKKISKFSN